MSLALQFIFNRGKSTTAYIIRTTAFAVFSVAILLAVIDFFVFDGNYHSATGKPSSHEYLVFSNLIFAPLIENLLLTFILAVLGKLISDRIKLTISVGILFAVLHGFANQWAFIAGGILFSMMTYCYLDHLDWSFSKRFALITAQHVLFNVPTTAGIWLIT